MSGRAARLALFARQHAPLVLVSVREAKGSTPRETGAFMLVAPQATHETIGGGQLEFMAIDHARRLLAGEREAAWLAIPLGPQIGQCCGGHVDLAFTRLDAAGIDALVERVEREDATATHIYVFGAGHVGQALARALAPLPARTVVVETRSDALIGLDAAVETRLTALPEAIVAAAPAGSAFVVMTHDHALDFLLVGAALGRGDAAYVGMIGSKTKRVTFERWYAATGGAAAETAGRLICPIGGSDLRDKRPAVIAALVAAEVLRATWRPVIGQPGP